MIGLFVVSMDFDGSESSSVRLYVDNWSFYSDFRC